MFELANCIIRLRTLVNIIERTVLGVAQAEVAGNVHYRACCRGDSAYRASAAGGLLTDYGHIRILLEYAGNEVSAGEAYRRGKSVEIESLACECIFGIVFAVEIRVCLIVVRYESAAL